MDRKFTENLAHAQSVCTMTLLPRREGPGDEANAYPSIFEFSSEDGR